MAVAIARETPLQDDVRAMVAALNAHLVPLSPREFQFQLAVEEMAGPDMVLFVARDRAGEAVGMGALKVHDDGFGEVKRMFTCPAMRGTGIGRAIIGAIEAAARERGLDVLRLETGGTPGFEGTWAVYERCGFARCSVFAGYPDTKYNVFYEKKLT
ncbi:GNAT family N-acetyltransferase [Oricola thermophila]|uniref:GNAT family N-acetyltransferase n=1 Tax=Oricola thermophila TaxID=2742145 RepID=A0A6N1VEG1_9HYPH|nr:GNAT family N-acetyltransferase [Oricola thermophila]QKV17995.1 GNAT family N-acetyltransferase [Oricola thermophila]